MKKFYYIPMAALALFLNSCNDVDEELQELTSREVITASVSTIESRTTADGLDILWSANDQIGVFKTINSYTTDSYEHNCFTLVQGGEGKTTASFAASTSKGETNTLAYYPYIDGSSYDGATLSMSIPASQSYADGCQMVMAGTFAEGSSSVSFKNAMALAVITVNNIPTGYTKAVLTAAGDEKLNGAANVTFTSNGQAELELASDNAAGTNTLTIEFGSNTDANKTFYFAIPVDEYSNGLQMTLVGENMTTKVVGTLTDKNDATKFTANANEFHTYTRSIDDVVSNVTSVATADELTNALANGGNIKLTASIDLNLTSGATLTIGAEKEVNIDLNGYTLTTSSNTTGDPLDEITVKGKLSVTNGEIKTENTAFYVNGGELTLEDLTITGSRSCSAVYVDNSGTVTAKDVTANTESTAFYASGGTMSLTDCNVTITDGSFNAVAVDNSGKLTISGGSYTSVENTNNYDQSYAILVKGSSEAIINTTVSGGNGGVTVLGGSTTNFTGGSYTGVKACGLYVNGSSTVAYANSTFSGVEGGVVAVSGIVNGASYTEYTKIQ